MANVHEKKTTGSHPGEDGAQSHDGTMTLGAHMQDIGTQIKETAQEVGAQVKETVQDMGTQVKETTTEYYEQGRESLQDLNQTLEAHIRARPLQSLLMAGGVGMLIGLLWRRG